MDFHRHVHAEYLKTTLQHAKFNNEIKKRMKNNLNSPDSLFSSINCEIVPSDKGAAILNSIGYQ